MDNEIEISIIKAAAKEITCSRFYDEKWTEISTKVPLEKELTVYINSQELVSIMCSPIKLNFLIIGFLYSEGIISGMEDIMMLRVCEAESEVDVRLANASIELPKKKRLTSGCGGGTSFSSEAQKIDSSFVVMPNVVLSFMKQFQKQIDLYQLTGGIHTSALADNEKLLVMTVDIGRHNTIDKIQGECLATGISTKDRIIMTTGRVSSEMLLKAARMNTPVVVSRHTPTETAISLACDLGIALVGRVHGNNLTVYSHPERLGCTTK